MRHVLTFAGILILSLSAFAADDAAPKKAGTIHPYMCAGPMADAIVAELPDGKIAVCGDVVISQKDIDEETAKVPEYARDQVKAYPILALEQGIVRSLLTKEAKAWVSENGKNASDAEDKLLNEYLTAKVAEPTVTEAEVKAFYDQNSASFQGATFDQVKTYVEKFLKSDKLSDARDEFISSIGKRNKIEVSSTWLDAAAKKWALNPVEQARLSGKPSFVVFNTVGCCDKMGPVVADVKAKYGDTVNVVAINMGKEQVLARLYRVKASPVLFFFDKEGKEVLRENSVFTTEQACAKLTEMGVK